MTELSQVLIAFSHEQGALRQDVITDTVPAEAFRAHLLPRAGPPPRRPTRAVRPSRHPNEPPGPTDRQLNGVAREPGIMRERP
jgi:hypothetical protein